MASSTTELSDLPDEILVNILSLLPTKFAVTTSLLLSRRWHYLWTSITNLKLSQDMFKGSSKFINFVDRVTVLRKGSSLDSFSLQYREWSDDHITESRVKSWITSVIQCNVKNINLQIDTYGVAENLLPVCLFCSQSLVKFDLTMGGYYYLRVPSSCSTSVFPNLKSLSLCGVIFADHESAQKMLSCPLLEELSIKRCYWDNVRSIWVFSPNLNVLDIEEDYHSYATYYPDANYKVCFVADNLCSFRYEGSFYNEYQICASSSSQLSTAVVYVSRPGFHGDVFVYVDRYLKLVNCLSKAHILTLAGPFKILDITPDQLDKMSLLDLLTILC